MVTTTADLNLHPDLNGNIKIFCSQYDNALREIVFTIYDGDDLADLTGLTAKVEGTKPDKYGYSYDATINTTNSTVTVTLVTQMTCVAGLSHAEIVLYSGNSRVGTANFLLMVEEAGISDDTIVSDSVIPGIHDIDTLVEYAQTYADNAEASALEAEGYAAGTQNGTAVESGSTYYQNNAKYYCEHAWEATPEGYEDLVEQVETNTTDIATNATDISNVLNMLCDEWSSTVYYKAGDWLHYNGILYKVNVGAQTAFAAVVPPNASYYDVKTITEALEELRSIIADTYSDMQTYTAGQIITFQGKLYKVIVDCTGITPPNTSYYTSTTVAELIADNATDISTLNSNLTNYSTAISQPNLLDNPWFTVNQRGKSSYTGINTYTVDRWMTDTSSNTVTVVDDGITLSASGFKQKLSDEQISAIAGKTITISMILDGVLYSYTETIPDASSSWDSNGAVAYLSSGETVYFDLYGTTSSRIARVFGLTQSHTIRALKIEIGSVSTLANDVAPNYATELAKCKRYFQRLCCLSDSTYACIGFGTANSTTRIRVFAPIPVEMRITPSLTASGTFKTQNGATSYPLIVGTSGSIEINSASTGTSMVGINVYYNSAPGFSIGDTLELTINNDSSAYIDLSADL